MTARILDVKYHILLPDAAMVGSPLDYYRWAPMKSLSGFEAYRRVSYRHALRDVAQHDLRAISRARCNLRWTTSAGAGDDRHSGR
jgi:hypothetical protein